MQLLHSLSAPLLLHRQKFSFFRDLAHFICTGEAPPPAQEKTQEPAPGLTEAVPQATVVKGYVFLQYLLWWLYGPYHEKPNNVVSDQVELYKHRI